jgi:hypothetical protein
LDAPNGFSHQIVYFNVELQRLKRPCHSTVQSYETHSMEALHVHVLFGAGANGMKAKSFDFSSFV